MSFLISLFPENLSKAQLKNNWLTLEKDLLCWVIISVDSFRSAVKKKQMGQKEMKIQFNRENQHEAI